MRASDAEDALLWTCAGCGCDFNEAEMRQAIHQKPNGVLIAICTVCRREGDFIDGPDCFADGTWSVGWFLTFPTGEICAPTKR